MQDGPLSDEELDELADFLMSDATGEEAMDISMLDGYLTALAIAPNNLPPSTWMPQVWGEGMEWQSRELADRMISLVFRQANDILFYLRDEPESFVPLLYDHEVEGTTVTVIDEWCAGFVAAMALDDEGWRPMLETEAGATLLHPIMLYGTDAGWEELEADPELAARHDEIVASLGEIVMAIQAWWLPERKTGPTVRREQPKVGGNEPCPCGSGKKFEACCGGERLLH